MESGNYLINYVKQILGYIFPPDIKLDRILLLLICSSLICIKETEYKFELSIFIKKTLYRLEYKGDSDSSIKTKTSILKLSQSPLFRRV